MPLTAFSLSALCSWTLDTLIPGFANDEQVDPGQSFNLANLNLTIYGQLRADNYNIPVGASFDFDLWSFTDLQKNLTGFTTQGVIAVFIKPIVGDVGMAPSPSNGLQWPVQSNTPLTPGGIFVFSLPVAGPAKPVTPTSRNIRLTNTDVVAATGYFLAVGG